MLPAHLNAACNCVCILARSHVARCRVAAALVRKLSQQRVRVERAHERAHERERSHVRQCCCMQEHIHIQRQQAKRDVRDARQL